MTTETENKPLIPAPGENEHIDKMLHDVFVTALEGGISYWASVEYYHWTTNGELDGIDLVGFYAVIVESESRNAPMRVERSTIAKAFERLTQGPVQYLSETSRHQFLAMLHARLGGLNDYSFDIDYDAGDADNILQLGLLGEIVYG